MSVWQIGRRFSEESKKKMSAAKKGKKLGEKHIKNLIEANRKTAKDRVEKNIEKYKDIYKEIIRLRNEGFNVKNVMENLNLSRDKYYRVLKYCEIEEK